MKNLSSKEIQYTFIKNQESCVLYSVVSNNFIISDTDMASEEVSEEIEAVTAILDEDTVDIQHDDGGNPVEISIKITPLTASEQEKQYVSLTLVVTISEGEVHGASNTIPLKIDFV